MQHKIFTALICALMFVGSAFAGPLSSITDRFATYLYDCTVDIKACDNRCSDHGAYQMLTRDGWVLSPAKINSTCANKCKRLAVAECAGVPHVVVKLL